MLRMKLFDLRGPGTAHRRRESPVWCHRAAEAPGRLLQLKGDHPIMRNLSAEPDREMQLG